MKLLSDLLTANIPQYEVKIPSTGKKTKFRPFLVKEEKILLLAQQTNNNIEILRAMKRIIECCVDGIKDASSLPLFDIEYLFIKLRSKSVSELSSPTIICPFTKEEVELKINLEEIEVKVITPQKNKIKIKDDLIITMNYPSIKVLQENETADLEDSESFYNLVVNCIDTITTKDETINCQELSKKEISDFIDNMTKNQFEKILDFFLNSPRLEHTVQYTTSDGTEREVTLSGISDFFG